MPRQLAFTAHADLFGPTGGGRVRLADPELFIGVETDEVRAGEGLLTCAPAAVLPPARRCLLY